MQMHQPRENQIIPKEGPANVNIVATKTNNMIIEGQHILQ